MVQTPIPNKVTPFRDKLQAPLSKRQITTLQINLGKVCNLACTHCHVEAGPKRTEQLSPEVRDRLIEIIDRFPQIQTVDLTGGAPEMNFGFEAIVLAATQAKKEVIVRSNLTIYFVPGYEFLPEFCARNRVRIVASLPCYLADNVDKMRGNGVFDDSIKALQWLNSLGYGNDRDLVLDLVYNPPLPTSPERFSLPPQQAQLEAAYKAHLGQQFGIQFNHLLTITNLPIGRTKQLLDRLKLRQSYTQFLEDNYNASTVENLMCRDELSVDYRGYIYDCDFNQMEDIPAKTRDGEVLTVAKLLEWGSLDLIDEVATASYCYGCTAGSGSSCGGALLEGK